MRSLWQSVRKLLWIATTPLALTVLLASPAIAEQHGEVRGSDLPPAEAHAPAAEGDHGGGHHAGPVVKNWIDFGWSSKDDQGGAYEPEQGDHKMPAPFSMALLNFGVLLFLLGKFAAPAFKKMVRDRHDLVAKQLSESARLRDEAAAKLEEYARKVAGLDAEIAALVDGVRRDAEADKARLISEAETRAARMKTEAQQQIQAEIARVRLALEREVTETAIAVATKILTEKASDADHRALADRFVKELGQARPRV